MRTSRVLSLVIFLFSLSVRCFSQDLPVTKNALYFELFGNAGLYSINYERNISPNVYCRIGFETFKISDLFYGITTGRVTTFPLMAGYLTGHGKHHLELSGGFLVGKRRDASDSNNIFNLTSFFGYRFQSLMNKGLLFRIGLTPMVSLNRADYPDRAFLSVGMSLGYHF